MDPVTRSWIALVAATLFAIASAWFSIVSAPPRLASSMLRWRPLPPVAFFLADDPAAPTARDGYRIVRVR